MKKEIAKILEDRVKKNENISFIKNDPIQIPKNFKTKKDIEITAFITSLISWGNRKQIINNGYKLLRIMNFRPYEFIMNFKENKINYFRHRTFNEDDLINVIIFLKYVYLNYSSLEDFMYEIYKKTPEKIKGTLIEFYKKCTEIIKNPHTLKHISNIQNNSPAKRLNLFFRWMVRDGNVDFGIWKNFSKAELYIPLDTHVGRNARMLNLLTRKTNDWKSVEELTSILKEFDPDDPVKYDFALFVNDYT